MFEYGWEGTEEIRGGEQSLFFTGLQKYYYAGQSWGRRDACVHWRWKIFLGVSRGLRWSIGYTRRRYQTNSFAMVQQSVCHLYWSEWENLGYFDPRSSLWEGHACISACDRIKPIHVVSTNRMKNMALALAAGDRWLLTVEGMRGQLGWFGYFSILLEVSSRTLLKVFRFGADYPDAPLYNILWADENCVVFRAHYIEGTDRPSLRIWCVNGREMSSFPAIGWCIRLELKSSWWWAKTNVLRCGQLGINATIECDAILLFRELSWFAISYCLITLVTYDERFIVRQRI